MTMDSTILERAADDESDSGSARLAVCILIRGQVQGIGFRPFVYRLARQCRLDGSVRNSSAGVVIEAEGSRTDLDQFQMKLVNEAPPATQIDALATEPVASGGRSCFVIEASDPLTRPRVRLPRDLATCPECRNDIFDKENRRHGYPFTNCTACGPRYSILEAMPYDRPATAMVRFEMCSACRAEYRSAENRRFHAQPNACNTCGPQVCLWDKEGRASAGADKTVSAAAAFLRRGLILALKGLGGFQLLVRADDSNAVKRLRQRKDRPSKPLAVMVPSLEAAERIAVLGDLERRLLQSAQNPIVLADKRHGPSNAGAMLANEIAPNVDTLGLMLPTTPLHHLLLAEFQGSVVATSGNHSDEPIVTNEQEAVRRLAGIADVFLVHDRPIVRRVDDSLVRVIAGKAVTFRLARGYAPLPLPALEARGALIGSVQATGGHQKQSVALWTGCQAVLGHHNGDLDHRDSRTAFSEMTHDLRTLYQCEPEVIACDLHPDYFTTRWAFAQQRPVVQVQHHHAHAVSCMVEHDLLDREVLAIVWDGTGYGTDGTIWGGEILRASATGFHRVASLLPFPLPGGETAIHHPGRTAFGLLWVALGVEAILRNHDLLRRLHITPREAALLDTMIRKDVNTPWTSSMGRLFDAVAALILGIQEASYEGEPAVWLEAASDSSETGSYALPLLPAAECLTVVGDRSIPRGDWRPMLSAILDDLTSDVEPGIIAARFHNMLVGWADAVIADQAPADIVLSGGCFQNRMLTERMLNVLGNGPRRVFSHGSIPPGDGGLAVGQLAVAMFQRRQGSH